MSPFEKVELQSAIAMLRKMMPGSELNQMQPSGPAAVSPTLTTVWMMIMQRLGGGLSLKAVVKDALNHGADFFPDNKRVPEATLSQRDTAFNDVRTRLQLKTVKHLLQSVGASLIRDCSSGDEREVCLMDGTTLATSPTDDHVATVCPKLSTRRCVVSGKTFWRRVRV